MSKVLAIIRHAADEGGGDHHLIDLISKYWQEAGLDVKNVYGTRNFVPADWAFLHVDLSVCPADYVQFARRWPRVINGGPLDIRKSNYSKNLIAPGDGYTGPAIVKTSLNSAGASECFRQDWQNQRNWRYQLLQKLHFKKYLHRPGHWLYPLLRRTHSAAPPAYPFPIRNKSDYRIYPSADEVPPEYYRNPDLVVEKFLPEKDGEDYCLREWYFLGDHEYCRVELSADPIFTSGRAADHKVEPPPESLRRLRRQMGLDYGKIDYVMRDNEAVLFDVNKTTGIANRQSPHAEQLARDLAGGIFSLLET